MCYLFVEFVYGEDVESEGQKQACFPKRIIDQEVKHTKTGFILKPFRISGDEMRCQICLPERDVIMKKSSKNWYKHVTGKFHQQKTKDFNFI